MGNYFRAFLRYVCNHSMSVKRVTANYFMLFLRLFYLKLISFNHLIRNSCFRILKSLSLTTEKHFSGSINDFNSSHSLSFRDIFHLFGIRLFAKGISIEGSNWIELENAQYDGLGLRKSLQANLVFHVHYLEIAIEMIAYLQKSDVSFENIVFTCTDKSFRSLLEPACHGLARKDIRFLFVENSYRDARPFLIAVRELESRLPVLKIHTKKSPHLEVSEGELWRRSLLQELLPNSFQAELFATWLRQERVPAVICPKKWLSRGKHWGHNDPHVYVMCKELGVKMVRKSPFPMGTMFWVNIALLDELKKIQIPGLQPPKEMKWADSTWAHGFERVIGQIIASRGRGIATSPSRELERIETTIAN